MTGRVSEVLQELSIRLSEVQGAGRGSVVFVEPLLDQEPEARGELGAGKLLTRSWVELPGPSLLQIRARAVSGLRSRPVLVTLVQ